MTTKDFQADLTTGEACPGCEGEVVLVASDDGSIRAECSCSAATVLVVA